MFLSKNKKNNVYPCKPQFYYIKVGLRGSKLYRQVFGMERVNKPQTKEKQSNWFPLPQKGDITKTCLYNVDPFKPHIYIVKVGFTGVYIFLIFAQKHRLWVLLRTASPSTHNLCFVQKYEKYQNFCLKLFFFFLVVKFSVYLNRRDFVMSQY